MYGTLEVFTGPMFAGKTTELLKRILWTKTWELKNIRVIKPSFDIRYSETEIVTHDGMRVLSETIRCWKDYIDNQKVEPNVVFLDEIQFFITPHYTDDIVENVRGLLNNGCAIYASGLDMDWQGKPFYVTGQLLAMADKVHKLTANCTVSGLPATKTYKKTAQGGPIELGSTELYEARNNQFWKY